MSARKKCTNSIRTRSRSKKSDDDSPLSDRVPSKLKRPLKTTKSRKRASTKVHASVTETIDVELTEDEVLQTAKLETAIHQKVENFMMSGRFYISSDEEETETVRGNPNYNNKYAWNSLSGHEDERKPEDLVDIQSTPSTSAQQDDNSLEDRKRKIVDDDVMSFVDSVLADTNFIKTDNVSVIEEMKNLESFTRETEEMIRNTSSLLDEIRTGVKTEAEKVVEAYSSSGNRVLECPICLESLHDRAASVTICGHIFCADCILKAAKETKKCPNCRKAINTKKIHPIFL